MDVLPPLLEILAGEGVPIPEEHRLFLVLRETFETGHVRRVVLDEDRVVVDEGGDVLPRLLFLVYVAVLFDPKALDEGVPDVPRVGSGEKARLDVRLRGTEAGLEELELKLVEERELVDPYRVKFLSLVLEDVLVILDVAELDDGPVRELHDVLRLVVLVGSFRKDLQEREDDGRLELGEGAAE